MLPVGEGFEVPEGLCPASDWTWFKVRPGHVLWLTVVSSSPKWYRGHFVGKRMVPCLGDACELCSEGVGAQVRYVFGVLENLTGRRGLIELGRQPALLVRDRSTCSGGLRGLVVALTRYSNSKLSRIEVEFPDREPPAEVWDCAEPDLLRALVATWQSAKCPIPGDVMKLFTQGAAREG